eukprot:PhM_4_TR11640/c0_g1_i1/m.68208
MHAIYRLYLLGSVVSRPECMHLPPRQHAAERALYATGGDEPVLIFLFTAYNAPFQVLEQPELLPGNVAPPRALYRNGPSDTFVMLRSCNVCDLAALVAPNPRLNVHRSFGAPLRRGLLVAYGRVISSDLVESVAPRLEPEEALDGDGRAVHIKATSTCARNTSGVYGVEVTLDKCTRVRAPCYHLAQCASPVPGDGAAPGALDRNRRASALVRVLALVVGNPHAAGTSTRQKPPDDSLERSGRLRLQSLGLVLLQHVQPIGLDPPTGQQPTDTALYDDRGSGLAPQTVSHPIHGLGGNEATVARLYPQGSALLRLLQVLVHRVELLLLPALLLFHAVSEAAHYTLDHTDAVHDPDLATSAQHLSKLLAHDHAPPRLYRETGLALLDLRCGVLRVHTSLLSVATSLATTHVRPKDGLDLHARPHPQEKKVADNVSTPHSLDLEGTQHILLGLYYAEAFL